MVVNFSQFDCGEKPILVLKNLDGTAIQTLGYAFGIEADFSYNEVSTLTFNIPAQVDGREVPGYADVVGMRIIDLVGYGEFLLVNPEVESDGIKEIKTCKAYSLEHEFSKKMIFLEAGTFNFCDGIDYSNPNTIIGRIKECMPDWTFDISESLVGKYRTFDDINKNVYEFMKSDVQKKYQCIFDFNTYERLVIVHDVNKDVPTNQVYLSEDNLIHKIEIDEDSDNIITRLDVNGAEGVSIRSVNPTGTNKIYNLDYFMTAKNFSQEFIDTWRKWEEDCAAKQTLYYDITMSYNMKLLAILTKEAEIADLEAELVSKENILGAKIQLIAQSTNNTTKEEQQEALDNVNAEISNIKSNIANLKSAVKEMKANAAEVNTRRENINKELAFENYFTDKNDLAVLRRYFIDDVLQDSSFVAETAATYIEQDYSIILNNSSVSISEASNVIETVDASGNRVISFSGGILTMNSLTAKMIRGTLYFETSGDVVFSGYAENGTVGEASFLNGSITVSGTHSSLSVGNSSLVFAISNGRLYFTEKCSEYKQHQIEWELYEYGHQTLKERASPTYNFKVECSNFLTIDDYLLFQRQLTLGQKVYLYLDNKILEPYVVSVHVNFDDPTDFSIEFSSYYTSFDQSFNLAKLLDESVATGKTLSYKSGMYSAFVNSGASTAVKDYMDSALDIAKNAVLSSGHQAISYDDTGIRIRKWADEEKTYYEPEEIWMIDNIIAFTDNNWSTSKMAIGKIFDPNFVTSDNPEGLKYGIAAPYIVGTLLAGENLVIDTENGAFKVDSNGVKIDSLKLLITHGDTEDSLADYIDSRVEVSGNLNDAILEALEKTVTTHYQDAPPNAEELNTGDLWYVTGENTGFDKGGLYRWNGEEWQPIRDEVLEHAVKDAKATADGKINSYFQDTVPKNASHGDLWYAFGDVPDGYTSGKVYRYNDEKNKWEIIEDTSVLEAIDALKDGQIVTYYDDALPANPHSGDLWYVTGSKDVGSYKYGKLYRYNSDTSTWDLLEDPEIQKAITDAANAQAVADKKIVSFYTDKTPDNPGYGDIWYVTGKNSDGYVKGKLYRYNGNAWELVEDDDIPVIKNEISSTKETLSSIINENGYLKADQMQGVINTQATQMKSAAGNVLFDDQGLWLMNSPNKSTMTRAVWANENGILIGTGSASNNPAENWNWTTAIGPDGIVASAIAAGTLSGMNIVGGDLKIGKIGTSNSYNFVVDENGNVTANSGTFSGTIKATDIQFNDGEDYKSILNTSNQIEHDYLNLKGLTIKNEDGDETFVIDADGNVSVNGDITLGSGSKIAWGNVTGKPEFSDVATSGSYDDLDDQPDIPVLPDYLHSTYISETQIYSPEIYTNKFSVMGSEDNWSHSYELFSIYKYNDLNNPTNLFNNRMVLDFDSLTSAGIIAYSLAFSCYQIDFSKVSTVYDPNGLFGGGSSVAVFG